MKKVTNFIVEKRNYILVLFLILTGICLFLMGRVNINYDLTKYLPDDSSTKIGIKIMEEEFPSVDTSSLNVMFSNLDNEDKYPIRDELGQIDGVDIVSYDDSETYNKDNYTLYKLVILGKDDSKIAKDVYEEIKEIYADYEIYMAGDVYTRNEPVLSIWIVALAIFTAMIILFVMCDSYIEPFLIIFVIGLAVFLNKGTNIFFPSVSNITNSIVAILQMALSMDYSIMLINRYAQERGKEKNKVIAMKQALYHSFLAISSSSVTTIVGLLALVFMSFTIGKDLGIILAKGVVFSLISIFFVLPSLLILFDSVIAKTQKKHMNIHLDFLGNLSYSMRKVMPLIFILAFVGSYFLKGNLGISYTEADSNKLEQVFGKDNQIAIVYNNSNEELMANYCRLLESNAKVDNILCYGNTINQELTANDLVDKMSLLGDDVNLDAELIKFVYYNYYAGNKEVKMSLEEFVNFVRDDISKSNIGNSVSKDMLEKIDLLNNFASQEEVNKKRSEAEIAEILGLPEAQVKNLIILKNAKDNTTKVELSEIVRFIQNYVLSDDTYSKSLSAIEKKALESLASLTDKKMITKKMSSKEMANFMGLNEQLVDNLYKYYVSLMPEETEISINEFVSFLLNNVVSDPEYSGLFSDDLLSKLEMVALFTNKDSFDRPVTIDKIAELLGMNEADVRNIYLLYYLDKDTGSKYNLAEFVNNVVYLKNNTSYLDNVVVDKIVELKIFSSNQALNTTRINRSGLKQIFDSLDPNLVDTVYNSLTLPDNYLLTSYEFVDLVLNNFNFYLDIDTISNLQIIQGIMQATIDENAPKYSVEEMSSMFGFDCQAVYTLSDLISDSTDNWVISPKMFVETILNNAPIYDNLPAEERNNLLFINQLMNNTLEDKKFTYAQMAPVLGLPVDMTKGIYTLIRVSKENIALSPVMLVDFILEHQNDEVISSNMSMEVRDELKLAKTIMSGVLNDTKYSPSDLNSLLGIDKDKMELIYSLYEINYLKKDIRLSLYDMVNFLRNNVYNNRDYQALFSNDEKEMLNNLFVIMGNSKKNYKYDYRELGDIISSFDNNISLDLLSLVYKFYGSKNCYDTGWTMNVYDFGHYVYDEMLSSGDYKELIDSESEEVIGDAVVMLDEALDMLVGDSHSRIIINTKLPEEGADTFDFIENIKNDLDGNKAYVAGNSAMAYEMSNSFAGELNLITILTMLFIFTVVAITFKSFIIPILLVLLIQCAVYITMGALSFMGGNVYFIAILIVQSILMGATIDYAILYTSYYLESRQELGVKEALVNSYNKSIHTIFTSASILMFVTLIIGNFASQVAAKICKTISIGTLCSTLLILIILPSLLAGFDRLIIKKN